MNPTPNDRYPAARTVRLPDKNKWNISGLFARMDEGALRRILRPHEETSMTWERDASILRLRDELDEALADLTLYEIGGHSQRSLGLSPSPETDGAPGTTSSISVSITSCSRRRSPYCPDSVSRSL